MEIGDVFFGPLLGRPLVFY